MANYAQHFSTLSTPQIERAKASQVENSAGGFSFAVTPLKRLERFLILGCEGGTYYASEKALTVENAKCVIECLESEQWREVLDLIANVSVAGRSPKNDAAIFALAIACGFRREDKNEPGFRHSYLAREYALETVFPQVVRTGTHLFQFCEAVQKFRGWGRGLKRAVGKWYQSKSPKDLAYQIVKYQQREGWSHRDVLRLANPNTPDDPRFETSLERGAVLRYAAKGALGMGARTVARKSRDGAVSTYRGHAMPEFLAAFEELKRCGMPDIQRAMALVKDNGFTHEMVPSVLLADPRMWGALLERMPMTALIRNLARMTANGIMKPLSAASQIACERLTDPVALKKARVHPIDMLKALFVYKAGRGQKGSLSWSPVAQIVDALDAGFYESFGAVEPTGKRIFIALDVSASMTWGGGIGGVSGFTPREASACMAMVTMRTEKQWLVKGFSHTLVDVPITARMRLDDVKRVIERIHVGATDCSLPMLYARDAELDVDAFVLYTDSESFYGGCHPHQALESYRNKRGIAAKSAVVAMTATEFTIADPADAGQLDVVGFDTATPNLLADFFKSG